MQRQKKTFPLVDDQYIMLKRRMLSWAQQFSILLFLDNNSYQSPYNRFECLLGVNPVSVITGGADGMENLTRWYNEEKDWLFGHIAYDYKNFLEPRLSSSHPVRLGFPLLNFFCPEVVCYVDKDKRNLIIESLSISPEEVYQQIRNSSITDQEVLPVLTFKKRIDKHAYLSTIDRLRKHIVDGDCYEINFCSEGYCEGADVHPLSVFNQLNRLSPAPFAAYYRLEDKYLMSASPERYLYKDGSTVMSQPIKGTSARDNDALRDHANKVALQESIKDRAENVMIVDLVRNDLARSCEVGSVNVEELFGVYSFPQVHQMISTVTGKMRDDCSVTDAIKYSFPMGSMTGAPKIKVMELIEQYEHSGRELFAGTVGYMTPGGDFDFNVVIRSLFYNAETKCLSYQTGGAITYDSDPLQEWDEMRLKAWALERIFSA